jgi:metal-responsive CopG/Arc/MetJ family transcriptional regulator
MDTLHPDQARAQDPVSETLHVRVPAALLAQVDRLVGTRYLRRGEAVRGLLNAGLKSEACRE